jgi:hypothetical protein
MVKLFGESPILYNDIMLLKGGMYLVIDIAFTKRFLLVAGIILTIICLFLTIPILFHTVVKWLEKIKLNRLFVAGALALWIFISTLTYWFGFYGYQSVVQWISPKVVQNVKSSLTLWNMLRSIKSQPIDSTYYKFEEVYLDQKPNIYLIMVESYGKVLLDNIEISGSYLKVISQIEDTLKGNGWLTTSSFSKAPIFGGRSWLSMGSLFTGMQIKDQVIYSYMLHNAAGFPHLINYLNSQGYSTFALQPLNRPRPGYSLSNYEKFYAFKKYINSEDLNFFGPAYGFRNVPDQYSLNYAHQKFLSGNEPIFLFFLTVTSHSPWIDLPPYLADWREIKSGSKEHIQNKYGQIHGKLKETFFPRFSQGIRTFDYAEHIFYELKVIRDYILNHIYDNSIIIILGDHQPPLITGVDPSFATPIHIITKDIGIINYFQKHGFEPGLRLSGEYHQIKHEALYSLLIRGLAINYSKIDSASLPVVKPNGISLSIIQ